MGERGFTLELEFNEFEPNKEAPLPADEGLESVFPRWSDWVLLEDNRDRPLRLFIEPLMRLALLHNLWKYEL